MVEVRRSAAPAGGRGKWGSTSGLTHFAVLSDGRKVDNPRIARKAAAKLRRARRLAACSTSLAAGEGRYRGMAVVPNDIPRAELAAPKAAGVLGVTLNAALLVSSTTPTPVRCWPISKPST